MQKQQYSKSFYVMVVLIVLLLAAAVIAPVFAPNDPYATDITRTLEGPSADYPLGTDPLGRCVLSRILYGAQVSIFASLAIVLIVFCVGTVIGVIAGYAGGVVDKILSKIITIIQAFPQMILAIAIAGVLGIGIGHTILALSLIGWAQYARVARSLTLGIKGRTYIQAAKICGESPLKILFRHVIPSVVPPLVVNASIGISTMIMEVASLSYLGIGVQSPMAEWGAMMNTGKDYMQTDVALVLIPGMAILLVSIVFNLFGEKLRDVLTRPTAR